ncbi:hypothetical protein ACQEUX_08695 [Micromonospora sp. CA-259024]|uniref:hypothetical protein n=1 Tax=Micromonospora sp. CA-259024 TaxID=3239965 RepID=UPI003D9219F9
MVSISGAHDWEWASFWDVTILGWLRAVLDRLPTGQPRESPAASPAAPECMSLLELARLLPMRHSDRVASAYVEVVTFASADEIVAMLKVMLEEDWMALPVWARNLAFRLACLQRPEDGELLHVAASDLRAFGPDWNHIAEELRHRADSLAAGKDLASP